MNRLLFQVRNDAEMPVRFLYDLDGVAAEFELNALEKEGARVIPRAGTVQKVSDLAEPLVRAGAHPLQALMSLHAVAGEYRKLHEAAKTNKER